MTRAGQFKFYFITFFILITSLIIIPGLCLSADAPKETTVTVVDDETDEPIEGAVAIAIWRVERLKDTWFEGTSMIPVRIEEATSDSKGNIFIKDFWCWHLFAKNRPRLTIYKFGYVCWDQQYIYVDATHGYKDRGDFNSKSRTARLKKWPKDFSFWGHESFIETCTVYDMDKAKKQIFKKATEFETPLIIEELNKSNEERRNK